MPDDLYDVVEIRRQEGGEIRRPLAGPYDLIDARYHAKRFATAINADGKSTSPDSLFIVVPHHICQMCQLLEAHSLADTYEKRSAIAAEMQKISHTCSHYYNTAEPV